MKRLKPMTREYIRKFSVLLLILFFVWMFNSPLWENYAFIPMALAILIYLFGPKTKLPEGAAHYSKISVLDLLGYAFWFCFTMLFYSSFAESSGKDLLMAISLFTLFSILPLYLIWLSVHYSGKWYLFSKNTFKWADSGGVQTIALSDIQDVEPYQRKIHSYYPEEIGIVISTKSKKIKILSNNLQVDETFIKHLRELFIAHNENAAHYFKDGNPFELVNE